MGKQDFPARVSTFYEQCFPEMLKLASNRISDPGTAEDLAQSAVIAVLQRGKLGGVMNLKAYHLRVLDNDIKKFFRENIDRPKILSADPWQLVRAPIVADIAEEQMDIERAGELEAMVRDCLDEKELRYFALKLSGLKPREIAKKEMEAGRPTTDEAVRWSLSNSRAKIRRRLGRESGIKGAFVYPWDCVARKLREASANVRRCQGDAEMLQNRRGSCRLPARLLQRLSWRLRSSYSLQGRLPLARLVLKALRSQGSRGLLRIRSTIWF